MHDKPYRAEGKRRWFQFRLSTWLVLIAILAWAMTARPYLVYGLVDAATYSFPSWIAPPPADHADYGYDWPDYAPVGWNPALLYPALALAAFIGWKAAWAIGRRVAVGRKGAVE